MIVKCEQCQTRFKIPDDKVTENVSAGSIRRSLLIGTRSEMFVTPSGNVTTPVVLL